MMRPARLAIVTALVLAAGTGLRAHHSFAPFNLQTEKTITGTVKQLDWTNPHIWIWLDVKNEQGVVETWGVEGMSPNFLGRRGWTKNSMKPGDAVTMTIRPLKDGSPGGMFVRATLADGTELTSGGRANQ